MKRRATPNAPFDETGAETIQLAFAIPILFITSMAVIQLCIMAFSTLTLEESAEQAAWAIDLSQVTNVSSPGEANELVFELVRDRSIGIDPAKLSISKTAFTSTGIYSRPPTPTPIVNRNVICDEDNRYQLAQMVHETSAGLIEFDVEYELPTLIELPGLSHVHISKHIARERVVSTRTEIS